MTINITLPNNRNTDGWIEAANRNNLTPEELILDFISQQGKSYADLFGIGVITSAAFIARFTAKEYSDILAASKTDQVIKGLLDTLLSEPVVNFDDPRLVPGLQTLVDSNLISAERVDELLSYTRPEVL